MWVFIDLKPMGGEESEAAQGEIRSVLSRFSGISSSLLTFLSERIQETLSGYTAAVAVNIYGPDLDQLDREAQQVVRVLSSVQGATEVQKLIVARELLKAQ